MRALLLLVVLCTAAAHADDERAVSAAEWSRPRSAAMVRELPGVRDCVQAWLAAPEQRLVLISPPGEEGGLWANELRDWLVALGVPSASIELRAVGTDKDRLLLRLEPALER